MITLTTCWNDIYSYLRKANSVKKRKRSQTIFYTQKYVEYDWKLNPTINDFIEQVSFSINWVYVEWWYYLRLYSIGWKIFDNASSDKVFLTKEDCIESLWKDPVWVYKMKRKQHYKNLLQDKIQKRSRLWNEIWEIENLLLKL